MFTFFSALCVRSYSLIYNCRFLHIKHTWWYCSHVNFIFFFQMSVACLLAWCGKLLGSNCSPDMLYNSLVLELPFWISDNRPSSFWSTRPTTIPAGSDHYFHTECPSVRTSVHPKTSKSSDNHCRPGLGAGRVDHWWLLSCISCFLTSWQWQLQLAKLSVQLIWIDRKKW